MNLDPTPWIVEEIDEYEARYSTEEYLKDSMKGDWGGHIYNLALFRPRPGYSQDRKDYQS